jgi:hypothetical protein
MMRRNTPGIGARTEKRSIDVCEAGKPYYDLAANPCYECLSWSGHLIEKNRIVPPRTHACRDGGSVGDEG